jgi:nucleoside-diphosphate-sugar epimerase
MTNPVVVTGAAGFIGAHVVRALIHQRRRVIATDLAPSLPEPVLRGLDDSGIAYLSGDLRSEDTCDALVELGGERADVVHVAALNRFAELAEALGERAPTPMQALEVFDVNAMGTWRLCSRFANEGVLGRFVYISTRSVFGGLETSGATIPEASPQQPVGIYGSSKTAGEVGVLAFRSAFDLDLVIARITGVYGPWQGPVSWIGKGVEAVSHNAPFRTEIGGNDKYELTYVKDTVRGLLDLIRADRLSYPIYHLSSGEMHSLSEVAEAFRIADPAAVVEFGSGNQPGIRLRIPLDGSRAAEELDFKPRWDLDAAIADYLEIERSRSYGVEASDFPPANEVGTIR